MSLKVWALCKKGNQEGRIKLNRMNSKVQESISTKQESFKFWKHDPRETNKQELKLQQALSKRKLQRAEVGFQEQTLKDLKINNKIFLISETRGRQQNLYRLREQLKKIMMLFGR